MRKIICNKVQCKICGDVIESFSNHDWAYCSCFEESKGIAGIYVDGGLEYLRRGGDLENFVELSEFEDRGE